MSKYYSHLYTYFRHKQAVSVGYAFVLMGAMFGTWATFIPWIKDRFQINDSKLGLLLLCFPIGAAIFNPLSAYLISKLNMRRATKLGIVLLPLAYCLPLNMTSISWIGFGLICTGMAVAQLNIAMNTCVAAIESNDKINIMSTSHGMFSVGLTIGSLISSLSYGFGIDPRIHVVVIAILFILGLFFVKGNIDSIEDANKEKPKEGHQENKVQDSTIFKNVLMMVVISVCANMTEGAMADWTGVYMKDIVNASSYFIGWGLAAYSLCMSIGRFSGDGLMPIYGGKNLLFFGAICVAIGLGLCVMMPYTLVCVIGFAIVGFGISFNSPIMYGSASRIPGMGEGKGLALLNSFGMIGFLGGPVIIGFISEGFGLKIAFMLIISLAILGAGLTRILKLY
jgi:predicted MFS family arabinose efflux permease